MKEMFFKEVGEKENFSSFFFFIYIKIRNKD